MAYPGGSFLLFELLLVCSLLHLELFSEFGVRFLERAVLCSFVGEALFQGDKFLVTTHNGFQSLRFLLGVGDHILHKEGDSDKQPDSVYQQEKHPGLTMAKSHAFLKFSMLLTVSNGSSTRLVAMIY
jgi:hypothetical protein